MDVDEPITLRPYDPSWARHGELLRTSLLDLCGDLGVEAEHIGSTAVPGMLAKPVIDIQLGTPDGLVEAVVDRLVRAGFEHIPDAGVSGREYLRRRDDRPANLHVVARGGLLWRDNLVFRDHLRSHPDAAARYAQAKADAAREHPRLLGYSRAKAEILTGILRDAGRAT